MNNFLPGIVLLLATASPAAAQGVFDGTWKGNVAASQMSTKPSVISLSGGKYTCSTCKPVISVAADGAYHAVTGNPYYDELMVTVVSPTTVKRTTKKAGKVVGESTATISADGKTMTTAFNDMSAENGLPVTGTSIADRVAPGSAGSHAMSGSWRQRNAGQVSDSGLTFTIKQVGKTVTYSTPTGIGYTATIGGPVAPVTGDPGWTSVSLKQAGPNTLIETDFHEGKTLAIYTMTVSADGKTWTAKVNDVKFGKRSTLVATKQ